MRSPKAQKEALAEALEATLATKSDIKMIARRLDSLDAKIDKLSWMLGILIALAIANFAKQFF